MCRGMSDDECEEILTSIPDFDTLHKKRTSEDVQSLLDGFLSTDQSESQESETERYGSASEASSIDQALNSLLD
jgi:hypothetical protein